MPARDWIVFDLETTGLSPEFDAVIQIAAVRMRDGRACDGGEFFSYVDPGMPIPPWITGYTGVRDRDVRGAPAWGPVLEAFSAWAGDALLVAHNGHRFDMRFLRAGCESHGLSQRPAAYHDSIWLSRRVWPTPRLKHGLDAVMERLRLDARAVRRHDARGDVRLLALALERMTDALGGFDALGEFRTETGVLPVVPSPAAAG